MRVWRGREGRVWKRKKKKKKGRSRWKKQKTYGRKGFGGLIFLQNIKPSSFGGTKKLYWRRVLGGFI